MICAKSCESALAVPVKVLTGIEIINALMPGDAFKYCHHYYFKLKTGFVASISHGTTYASTDFSSNDVTLLPNARFVSNEEK